MAKVKCSVVIDGEIIGVHTSTVKRYNFHNLRDILIKHLIRPHLQEDVLMELEDLEDFEPERAIPDEAERRVAELFSHSSKKGVHFFELVTNATTHMTMVKVP